MSKELSVIPFKQLELREIIDVANAFYTSGMFKDVQSAAQAIVKIQAGQEIGIAPFMAMSGLHVIQGKITIGGGVIAAKIKASQKYDYKLIEKTDTLVRIEFFENEKSVGIEKFDAEDARRAGTQNMQKYPRNMLFNRCISNGYKSYTPDVFMGSVYVPEEFGEADTSDVNAEVTNAAPGQSSAPLTVISPAPSSKKAFPVTGSEEFNKAVEFLKTGGTVDKLRVRYEISGEQEKELNGYAKMTTQQDIHKQNSTYVPPTEQKVQSAEPVTEGLTTDPF